MIDEAEPGSINIEDWSDILKYNIWEYVKTVFHSITWKMEKEITEKEFVLV